jgi:hypothetical protein
VPGVHAHAHDDDTESSRSSETPARERPISVADIDRLLEASAGAAESTGASPVRAWRDALTLALESLRYARTILAADVKILRHAMATEGPDDQAVVDDLPAIVTTGTWTEERASTDDPPPGAELDPSVFVRSDPLLSAHQEMARTDLSSPGSVARTLQALEEQLVAVTEREAAVGDRLRQIRATIVRQYEDGAVPSSNWPG